MIHSAPGVKNTGVGNYRWKVLLCLWLLYLINYFDRMAVLTLLPLIRTDLNLTHQEIGFAASIFFFAYAFAQLSAGWWADRVGPKKVMGFAITFFTLVTFITGLVQSYMQFLLCRLGLALGEGHHYVPANRSMSEWFPQSEKGRAAAFFSTIYSVAPAIIPVAVVSIASFTGSWRSVFYVLAIPGVLGMAMLWYFVSDRPRQMLDKNRMSAQEVEYIEDGLISAGKSLTGKKALAYLLKDKSFILYSFIGFCGSGMYWGSSTWLSSFLVEQHGFSLKAMGFLAALPYVIGFMTVTVGGFLVDKIFKGGVKVVLLCSFLPSAVLFYIMPHIETNVTHLILVLALFGFVVNLYAGAYYAYGILRYPKEIVGSAVGIANFTAQMGAFVAPLGASMFIVKTAESVSYIGAFTFFAAIALIGGVLSIFLSESHVKKKAAVEAPQTVNAEA